MKELEHLVEQSKLFTSQLITDNLSDFYCYHNIQHTQEVVDHIRFLCNNESIDEKSTLLLEIAAWFHDTGFICDYLNHEKESVDIAIDFLKKANLDEQDILFVEGCIMATELHFEKDDIYKRIISDADCFHLGLSSFTARTINLKHEWENVRKVKLTLNQMLAGSIMFLEQHKFYTNYGVQVLEAGKQKNLTYMIQLEKSLSENNY